jgi:hypothetical protein
MKKTEMIEHLTALHDGYKNQLAQLTAGLEQMLAQKEQIDTNIPLLESEIELVSKKAAQVADYIGIEEEE